MLANKMLTLQTISRNITPYSGAARHQLHTSIKLLSTSSSDSSDSGSDSDKETKKPKRKESVKNVETQSRRKGLDTLNTLITELNKKTPIAPRIDVAIPKKPPKSLPEKEPVSTEESRFEAKFTSAARNVAKKIGGDVNKTEMDLLDRLLKKKDTSDVDSKSETSPSLDQSDILKGIKVVRSLEFDREVDVHNERVERIRKVSQKVDNFQVYVKNNSSIIRNLLQEQNRSEFPPKESKLSEDKKSSAIKQLQEEKRPADEKSTSLERQVFKSTLHELKQQQKRSKFSHKESKSIRDEKASSVEHQISRSTLHELEKQQKRSETFRKEFETSQNEASVTSERPPRSQSTLWQLYQKQRRALGPPGTPEARAFSFRFHARNFGIFEANSTDESQVPELSTWADLERKELQTLLSHPPQNYFQEMIQWTEQGKIWQFPIDNEQGMKGEENVHFSEHVFLERHLKDWCPKKGPIRHFMELVCVGLSKNAFMTVEEKIGHIMWYKDYFGDKRELIMELGAIENEDPSVLPKPTNRIDLGPHV